MSNSVPSSGFLPAAAKHLSVMCDLNTYGFLKELELFMTLKLDMCLTAWPKVRL